MSLSKKINTVKSIEYEFNVRNGLGYGQDCIAGVFSTYTHSWIASGPKLFIINHSDGMLQCSWTFGENSSEQVDITCATELIFEGCSIPLLIVGVSSENTNQICFFNPNTRKIIRCIELSYPVRIISVIEDGLNEVNPINDALTNVQGLFAAGCADGSLLIFDLCRSILLKALSGDFRYVRNEDNPVEINEIKGIAVNSSNVQRKLKESYSSQTNFAVHLTDNCDGGVTALCYSYESAILYVGTITGSFLLWNMSSLSCLFQSPPTGHAIISLSLLEPCDDPRHNLFLWICYENHDKTNMYCMTFSSKFYVQGYGVYYQGFESAGLVYHLSLGMDEGIVVTKSFNCQSVAKSVSKSALKSFSIPEGDCSQLRLFITSYEVIKNGRFSLRSVIFDLNQWYKEQMPDEGASVCLDSLPLDGSSLWHLALEPSSLSHYQWVRPLEQHFHPSALDFKLWCIGEDGIRCIEKLGLQSQWLRNMSVVGPSALLSPTPVFHGAISAGLLPTFMDPPDPDNTNTEEERKYILTVCLENRAITVIEHCAQEWSTGSHPVAGCTLAFLIDWLWELHGAYKAHGNKMCIPLFDQSGIRFDVTERRSLQHCKSLLCTVQTLYSSILQKYNTYVLIDGIEQKLSAMTLVKFYFECCLKLIASNLLPEPNEAGRPSDSLVFKYEEIHSYVSSKRREVPFLGDSLIGNTGAEIQWEEEGGTSRYPPPSIQSVLRFCLHPAPPVWNKLSLMLYLYMDIIHSLKPLSEQESLDKVKNFQYLLRIPDVQFKIVTGFWHLDHSLFDEGITLLLDPRVLSIDISDEQHRMILSILALQGEEKLALQYLRLKSPDLHQLDDLRLELDLLLSNRLINEAFMFQRKHPEYREELLVQFFQGCILKKLLGPVFGLHLDPKEESVLLKFLKTSNLKEKGDLQVLLLLSQAKYTEAISLNDRLNSTINGPKAKLETDTRDMIVRGITGGLNTISRDLAYEMRHYRPPPTGTHPKPLSAVIKIRSEADGPLCQSDSHVLLTAAAKSTRHLSDFICDVPGKSNKKRVLEDEECMDIDMDYPPRKKIATMSNENGIVKQLATGIGAWPSTPTKTTSNKDREVMDLVGTPLVRKRGKKFSPHSKPSSILKGKTPDKHMHVDDQGETPRKTLRFALPRKDIGEKKPLVRGNILAKSQEEKCNTSDSEAGGDINELVRKRVTGRKSLYSGNNKATDESLNECERNEVVESIRDRLRSAGSSNKLREDGGVDWKDVAETSKPKVLFSHGVSKVARKEKPSTPVQPKRQVFLDLSVSSAEKKYLESPSREGEVSPVTVAVFNMEYPEEILSPTEQVESLENDLNKVTEKYLKEESFMEKYRRLRNKNVHSTRTNSNQTNETAVKIECRRTDINEHSSSAEGMGESINKYISGNTKEENGNKSTQDKTLVAEAGNQPLSSHMNEDSETEIEKMDNNEVENESVERPPEIASVVSLFDLEENEKDEPTRKMSDKLLIQEDNGEEDSEKNQDTDHCVEKSKKKWSKDIRKKKMPTTDDFEESMDPSTSKSEEKQKQPTKGRGIGRTEKDSKEISKKKIPDPDDTDDSVVCLSSDDEEKEEEHVRESSVCSEISNEFSEFNEENLSDQEIPETSHSKINKDVNLASASNRKKKSPKSEYSLVQSSKESSFSDLHKITSDDSSEEDRITDHEDNAHVMSDENNEENEMSDEAGGDVVEVLESSDENDDDDDDDDDDSIDEELEGVNNVHNVTSNAYGFGITRRIQSSSSESQEFEVEHVVISCSGSEVDDDSSDSDSSDTVLSNADAINRNSRANSERNVEDMILDEDSLSHDLISNPFVSNPVTINIAQKYKQKCEKVPKYTSASTSTSENSEKSKETKVMGSGISTSIPKDVPSTSQSLTSAEKEKAEVMNALTKPAGSFKYPEEPGTSEIKQNKEDKHLVHQIMVQHKDIEDISDAEEDREIPTDSVDKKEDNSDEVANIDVEDTKSTSGSASKVLDDNMQEVKDTTNESAEKSKSTSSSGLADDELADCAQLENIISSKEHKSSLGSAGGKLDENPPLEEANNVSSEENKSPLGSAGGKLVENPPLEEENNISSKENKSSLGSAGDMLGENPPLEETNNISSKGNKSPLASAEDKLDENPPLEEANNICSEENKSPLGSAGDKLDKNPPLEEANNISSEENKSPLGSAGDKLDENPPLKEENNFSSEENKSSLGSAGDKLDENPPLQDANNISSEEHFMNTEENNESFPDVTGLNPDVCETDLIKSDSPVADSKVTAVEGNKVEESHHSAEGSFTAPNGSNLNNGSHQFTEKATVVDQDFPSKVKAPDFQKSELNEDLIREKIIENNETKSVSPVVSGADTSAEKCKSVIIPNSKENKVKQMSHLKTTTESTIALDTSDPKKGVSKNLEIQLDPGICASENKNSETNKSEVVTDISHRIDPHKSIDEGNGCQVEEVMVCDILPEPASSQDEEVMVCDILPEPAHKTTEGEIPSAFLANEICTTNSNLHDTNIVSNSEQRPDKQLQPVTSCLGESDIKPVVSLEDKCVLGTNSLQSESKVSSEPERKISDLPVESNRVPGDSKSDPIIKPFFFGKNDNNETYLRTSKATFQVGSRSSLPNEDESINPMEVAILEVSGTEDTVIHEHEVTDPRNTCMLDVDLSLHLSEDEEMLDKPATIDKSVLTVVSHVQSKTKKSDESNKKQKKLIKESNKDKNILQIEPLTAEKEMSPSEMRKVKKAKEAELGDSDIQESNEQETKLKTNRKSRRGSVSNQGVGDLGQETNEGVKEVRHSARLSKKESELKGILKNKNLPPQNVLLSDSSVSAPIDAHRLKPDKDYIQDSSEKSAQSKRLSKGTELQGILKKSLSHPETRPSEVVHQAELGNDIVASNEKIHILHSNVQLLPKEGPSKSSHSFDDHLKKMNDEFEAPKLRGILKNRGRRSSCTSETSVELRKRLTEDFPEEGRKSRCFSEEPEVYSILKRTEGHHKSKRRSHVVEQELQTHFEDDNSRRKSTRKQSVELEPSSSKKRDETISLSSQPHSSVQVHENISIETRRQRRLSEEPEVRGILKKEGEYERKRRSSCVPDSSNDLKDLIEERVPENRKRSRRHSIDSCSSVESKEFIEKKTRRASVTSEKGSEIKMTEEDISNSRKQSRKSSLLHKYKDDNKDDGKKSSRSSITSTNSVDLKKRIEEDFSEQSATTKNQDTGYESKSSKRSSSSKRHSLSSQPFEGVENVKPKRRSLGSHTSVSISDFIKDLPEMAAKEKKSRRKSSSTPDKKSSPSDNIKKSNQASDKSKTTQRKLNFVEGEIPSIPKKSRSLHEYPIRRSSRLCPILEDIKEEDEETPRRKRRSLDDLDAAVLKKTKSSKKRESTSTYVVAESDSESEITPSIWSAENYAKERKLTRNQKKILLRNQQTLEESTPSPSTSTPRKQRKKTPVSDSPPRTPTRSSLRLQKKPPSEKD